jgi:hypothetical protein
MVKVDLSEFKFKHCDHCRLTIQKKVVPMDVHIGYHVL